MAIPSAALSAYNTAASRISGAGAENSISVASPKAGVGQDFGSLLHDMLNSSLNTARGAESISASALQGKSNIADVVAAVSNAEVTLQTVMSIRDRIVNGIQEIMRMPV